MPKTQKLSEFSRGELEETLREAHGDLSAAADMTRLAHFLIEMAKRTPEAEIAGRIASVGSGCFQPALLNARQGLSRLEDAIRRWQALREGAK